MTFDGITTRCVVTELNGKLKGGKIDKIYQVAPDELNITIRNNNKNYTLLLSSSSNYPRFYISSIKKTNPADAPMFSMLLRKHLQGGKIVSVVQNSLDRIIKFIITSKDEIGDKANFNLILEMTGRNNNIILIDSDNTIIDSIKRIPASVSRLRQVLPGLKYENPPVFEKLDPLKLYDVNFYDIIKGQEKYLPVYKNIYNKLLGFSPKISKEICHMSGVDPHKPISSLEEFEINYLSNSLNAMLNRIKYNDFYPSYIEDKYENIVGFYAFPINYESQNYLNDSQTMSEILDRYYKEKDSTDKMLQKTSHIRKLLSNETAKENEKLIKLKEEYSIAENREAYKLYADLLSAYQYEYTPGLSNISVLNFYSEYPEYIDIKLDEKLNLQANIQKYYKKYTKLKKAESMLKVQIDNTKNKIDYLENLKSNVEMCETDEDVDAINHELMEQGLRKKVKANKKNINLNAKYAVFTLNNGNRILVGKNNLQNDYLTHKIASKWDYWFHVKNFPGSHVILQIQGKKSPDNSDLVIAAKFAVYFSSIKSAALADVDFTKKTNVKRHPNRLPGMVYYENYETIRINIDREEFKAFIDKLK